MELDCLALQPSLESVQSAYSDLVGLRQEEEEVEREGGEGEGEGEGGEGVEREGGDSDDALEQKDSAEHRYKNLMDRLRQMRTSLDSELSE